MSNEPVKLELDCALAPYSHHHHHHLPHHNPHLQHHHGAHISHHLNGVISSTHTSTNLTHDEDEDDDDELIADDDDDQSEKDDQTKNSSKTSETLVHEDCYRGHVDRSIEKTPANQHSDTNDSQKLLTQLETVVSPSKHKNLLGQNSSKPPIEGTVNAQPEAQKSDALSPSSASSSDDSSESDEEVYNQDGDEDIEDDDDDDDNGDVDEEDEEGEVDEDEDDGDDEDEDEYDDSDDDSFGIVDPVGQHPSNPLQSITVLTGQVNCHQGGDRSTGYEQSSCNVVDGGQNSDDDVSFDSDLGDSAHVHDDSAQNLLDSERMLEVTRKLVRSTELDPDRDLRKQVLLRTAIRKLPHFMEYNHYTESFDQSFQMHNNSIDNHNSPVNCLSPSQHYEHHHISLNHHLEPQPKSYYNSVQPNAIQMSTTSLRMLDLNDDTESDTIVNTLEVKQHHYENSTNVSQQSSLEQSDFASNTYGHQYTTLAVQSDSIDEHNHQRTIHEFNQYDQESNTGMMSRHDTLDNLYQPLESSDMNVDAKSEEQTLAFPVACDYSRVSGNEENVYGETETGPNIAGDEYDPLDNSSSSQTIDVLNLDRDVTPAIDHGSRIDHNYPQEYDCNQNQTNPCHNGNSAHDEFLGLEKSECANVTPPIRELVPSLQETIEGLSSDHNSCSDGSNSNSSQSSTSSEESVNSASSQSNDSAGDLNGLSMLETSLNTSNNYHHSSHDSGVVLFTPRSNKRSSSSIGLDDDMDIDQLSDLTSSNQFNSDSSLSNLNHCKKLRKREIID